MATIWEETKKQTLKMKGRPLKEKLAYIWEYYHIVILIAAGAIFILASLIKAFVTSKDYALSVVMINSVAGAFEGVTDEWTAELTDTLDFDQKKYEVYIDTSIMIGGPNVTASQEYASLQKFAALMSSKSMDIITADTPRFEQYAQNQYFCDLRDVFSQEELDEMTEYIYYTDAATYSDYGSDVDPSVDVNAIQAAYVIDHRDPSSMKEPVPVGFFIPESSRLGASGIYSHLPAEDAFQGHTPEAVIGIAINSPRLDNAKTGVEFFLNNN